MLISILLKIGCWEPKSCIYYRRSRFLRLLIVVLWIVQRVCLRWKDCDQYVFFLLINFPSNYRNASFSINPRILLLFSGVPWPWLITTTGRTRREMNRHTKTRRTDSLTNINQNKKFHEEQKEKKKRTETRTAEEGRGTVESVEKIWLWGTEEEEEEVG